MEQIFFDFKLNFNLFDPNTKKATSIYAVVYFKRKQYKINTGVKVYPSQTKLDNYNNTIVNNKLKQILLSFEQSKLYLCEHIESIPNLYELLKQYINPSMATKKKTTNGVSATAQMSLLLSTVDKDSTYEPIGLRQRYKKTKGILSPFASFILAAGTYAPAVVKLFEFSYRIFYNTDGFHEFHLVDHQRWGKTDNMLVGRFSQ